MAITKTRYSKRNVRSLQIRYTEFSVYLEEAAAAAAEAAVSEEEEEEEEESLNQLSVSIVGN